MDQIFLKKTKFLPHCDLELQLKLVESEINIIVGQNGIGKTSFLHYFAEHLGSNKSILLDQNPMPWFYTRKLKVIKQLMLDNDLHDFNQEYFFKLWNQMSLDQLEDRLTEDLSGGEFQSLRLCLALARDTEYYLLDEPSHYLDSSRKIILSKLFKEMIIQKKKVIIVEHDHDWIESKKNFQKFILENGKLKVGESWSI